LANRSILIALIVSAVFITGCVQLQKQVSNEKGTLIGKVTIGPLCPVERFPPDPRCQPTEETYKAWPIAIYTSDKKTRFAQIQPNLDGAYKIELIAGSYVVDLEKQHRFGKNLPMTVTIKPGEITTLNIDIDTGIR